MSVQIDACKIKCKKNPPKTLDKPTVDIRYFLSESGDNTEHQHGTK